MWGAGVKVQQKPLGLTDPVAFLAFTHMFVPASVIIAHPRFNSSILGASTRSGILWGEAA